ncbi:hypothetical protein EG329_008533 [Mollisiaceae sp. DMI_Dod_QoI]|nr:hypothetical protein EG329_008533 [Helotiales sp. DMI_Dod_QoI]
MQLKLPTLLAFGAVSTLVMALPTPEQVESYLTGRATEDVVCITGNTCYMTHWCASRDDPGCTAVSG